MFKSLAPGGLTRGVLIAFLVALPVVEQVHGQGRGRGGSRGEETRASSQPRPVPLDSITRPLFLEADLAIIGDHVELDEGQALIIETLLADHADAFDDHGAYQGNLDGFVDFVAREVWSRFRTTMHKLGQALIEIDGDVAQSETYAVCHHVIEEGGHDVADNVMGIRYLDRFERRDGAWRIARRALRWEWIRTDALDPLDPAWTHGTAGPGDPIFGPEASSVGAPRD